MRFDQKSLIILCVESFIFSGIYGLMFKSWVVALAILTVFIVLLSKPKISSYSIYVFSLTWGLTIAPIGFLIGGWIGGLVVGLIVFINGVRLHRRDLKTIEIETPALNWRRNYWMGQQNMN